jgi:cytochrome c oxidase assembly protein subunit 15
MGCPDWPKCFGQWVPPTQVSELPENYQEVFAVAGKSIAKFDAFKTWTEYINRLIGVIIGFLIFLTVVFAFPYRKSDPKIFWLSFLAFVLVGFQGWIGSRVVATDLATWMITIHMVIALVIVGLLIYTITRSQNFIIHQRQAHPHLKKLLMMSIFIGLIQTISGTQVREWVDQVALMIDNRLLWIDQAGMVFYFHRSLSSLNLMVSFYLFWQYRKLFHPHQLIYKSGLALLLLMSLQAFTGAILSNFGFPGQMQSIHLTLGSLTIGLQLFIAILVFTKTEIESHKA